MRKLIWHSNCPWASTGYGNQTALFAPRLAQHYDLKISSFFGLEGAPLTWEGVEVLPGIGGTYGSEEIPYHVRRYFTQPREGLVLTLLDVWVLDAKMCSQLNMASWTPVDHDPAPPGVLNFFRRSQAIPLAMSRFGMDRLADFRPIYVPHAVDTSVYKPIPREQARAMLGLEPDGFLCGMVAANKGNPSRKSFVAVLEAFAELRRRHEDVKLYLHTDLTGEWSHGVDLNPVIESLGIPADAVGFPDPYTMHFHPLSARSMANVYSALDVLLSPSSGEGFGIPVMEAQACGTPAIVTDFSAMPEVCGAGWTVKGSKTWTAQRSWQMTPNVADIYEALCHAYTMGTSERERLSDQARAHALKYDIEWVMDKHMLPALEEVQERLGHQDPIVIPARKAVAA